MALKRGIYVLGCGSHSKQVMDSFRAIGIPIRGMFDDMKEGVFRGVPILGKISDVKKMVPRYAPLFCAVGDNGARKKIMEQYDDNDWPNCIHPTADVSESVRMERGNYVGMQAMLLPDTTIGSGNIFNCVSLTGHDVSVGNYNHFSGYSLVTSYGGVKDLNFIGLHGCLTPGVWLGSHCIVGAGTIVLKSYGDRVKLVGNPAREIPYSEKWTKSG